MPAALEWRFKPDADHLLRGFPWNQPLPDCKHIGVVVQTRHACRLDNLASCRSNTSVSVRSQTYADAGPANENTAIAFAARYRIGGGMGEIGIIRGNIGYGSEILPRKSERIKQLFDALFVIIPAVVGCQCYHRGAFVRV